ncbi:MAG TPA: hypothetical protein PK200_01835 [Spirochaetota bacterium]|nr:hypothetical protein [Spirochaetota bacterium]
MKKRVLDENVYYTIAWSRLFTFGDKFSASRILPELPGILGIFEKRRNGDPKCLLFYGCWRDGLRLGLKNFFDPIFSKNKILAATMLETDLLYKYTVVDTSPLDMKDILYWLICEYSPEYNSVTTFLDSKRHANISVREIEMRKDQIVDNIPDFGL